MNGVNIFGQSWLELVFEGKNKSYGAYKLRQETCKTTLLALFYGLMIVTSVAGIIAAASLLSKNPMPIIVDKDNGPTIHTVDLQPRILQQPKTTVAAPSRPKTQSNLPPVAAHIPDPQRPVSTQPPAPEGLPESTGQGQTAPIVGPATVPAAPVVPAISLPANLDRQPEFPGGIGKFYAYIGNNFKKIELEDEASIRVFVSFVIEKDGSMTEIRVLRDPGYGAGTEAIRVLKSLPTKWKPGIIAGQPVRTAYSLPITIKL
ncbi:MAG: energy transducer TonB [Flavobacterium sp.]|nr:MAG: energy transducer TonB [Flavobacterium sp.]